MVLTALLAVVVLVLVLLLKRALSRPVDNIEEIRGGHQEGEYAEQARRDGINPDTALVYEQELKAMGAEIRRKDRERRRREMDDGIGGLDIDL